MSANIAKCSPLNDWRHPETHARCIAALDCDGRYQLAVCHEPEDGNPFKIYAVQPDRSVFLCNEYADTASALSFFSQIEEKLRRIRSLRPEKPLLISKKMVRMGLDMGVVKIGESPNDDGAVCWIGENWFYFGGDLAASHGSQEYLALASTDTIINGVFDALDDFLHGGDDDGPDAEYAYYFLYLLGQGVVPLDD